MATSKYLDLAGLQVFKELVDSEISAGDTKSLKTAMIDGDKLQFYKSATPAEGSAPDLEIKLPSQDLSGLLEKISGGVADNVVIIGANGIVKDSGIKAADLAAKSELNVLENGKVKDNADAINTITSAIGTVTEGKTVVDMINDAKISAAYNDSQVKADIKSNNDAINLLNDGASVIGSVDYKIAQAIAAIIDNPDETINSINELVTWINGHAEDALELNNKVTANEEAITVLETKVGEGYTAITEDEINILFE